MADKQLAVERVIHEEDSKVAGKIIPATGTRGNGRERFGIVERFHPELTAEGYYDDMDHDDALARAEEVLEESYWSPIKGDEINSQSVATLLFSMSVNESCHEAVTLLQRALIACGFGSMVVDGKFGPATLQAVNSTDEEVLLPVLVSYAKDFYRHIATVKPEEAGLLQGWLNRIDDAARA